MPKLRLISHKLCPYVQRAVIVATEKGVPFQRVDIDLVNKPEWFLAISPTGKVPLLEVTEDDGSIHILFESAVIAEYLDEISSGRLLPSQPLARARERAWIEYASATLTDIGQFYSAPTSDRFKAARQALERRLSSLEGEIAGPWFGGDIFGLVDAAFAPAFRYIEIFERRSGTILVNRTTKLADWSLALAQRPSAIAAVPADYEERLLNFVIAKKSHLAGVLVDPALLAA